MSSSNYKFSKLQCKDKISKSVETYENTGGDDKEKINSKFSDNDTKKYTYASTPVRKGSVRENTEDENLSPVFMRFTQDNADEEVDVVWDWDSPRTARKRIFFKKRILHSSPKIPRKQILFERAIPKFNSLKEKLESLVSQVSEQEKTSRSDDCLIVNNDSIFVKPKLPEVTETTDACDLFDDDSFDEEMIKCSQRVEEDYNISNWCTSIVNNNKIETNNAIEDDSFDIFLEEINEDVLLSQASGSSGNCSENYIHQQVPNTVASPRAISRTYSVPVNFLTINQNLNSKVTTSSFTRTKSAELNVKDNQTIRQFSQEDIEKKRLEAKAILDKKKKQNEIERNRQEALQRLNRNRMQRMQRNLGKSIKR